MNKVTRAPTRGGIGLIDFARRNKIALAALAIASVGIPGNCIDRRLKQRRRIRLLNRELASLLPRRLLQAFLLGTFSHKPARCSVVYRDYNSIIGDCWRLFLKA